MMLFSRLERILLQKIMEIYLMIYILSNCQMEGALLSCDCCTPQIELPFLLLFLFLFSILMSIFITFASCISLPRTNYKLHPSFYRVLKNDISLPPRWKITNAWWCSSRVNKRPFFLLHCFENNIKTCSISIPYF